MSAKSSHINFPTKLIVWLPLIATGLITCVGAILLNYLFPEWRFINYPIHAAIESIGSFAAFIVAVLILGLKKHGHLGSAYAWVSSALIAMGFLDGLHALLMAGNNFVWLHSIATFIGGFIFMFVWLAEKPFLRRFSHLMPIAAITLALVVGFCSLAFPQYIPAMVVDGHFTPLARSTNMIGGFGFLIAAFYFIFHEQNTDDQRNRLIFSSHCFLFGISGIIFEFSVIWDAAWWFWHALRIIAYLVAVAFYFSLARKIESELVTLRSNLEGLVDERTKALQNAETKTKQIINSAVDGIITIDPKGIILSFNSAAEKLFGYFAIEVCGKNLSMLMPYSVAKHHDMYLANYMNTGVSKVLGKNREFEGLRKNGDIFPMEVSASKFQSVDQNITFVGILRDISDRKKAEKKLQSTLTDLRETQDELVEVEKMASLGGLVAGVAHEINTPIGIGLTAATHLETQSKELAENLENGLLKKADLQKFISVAIQSTNIVETNLSRAADLVSSFKQIAVDQTSEEKREINLRDYIDEILQSLRPKLKQTKHEVVVSGDENIVFNTHPGAISQIITNLLMNSIIHAYDSNDEGHIRIEIAKSPDSVTIIFSDDGKGMPAGVSAKIFEPFFTTKRGSGGSGLGMHILYNQITGTLGGAVKLKSKLGEGATFEITIPIT